MPLQTQQLPGRRVPARRRRARRGVDRRRRGRGDGVAARPGRGRRPGAPAPGGGQSGGQRNSAQPDRWSGVRAGVARPSRRGCDSRSATRGRAFRRRARAGLPTLHPRRHVGGRHRTRVGDRPLGGRIARRRQSKSWTPARVAESGSRSHQTEGAARVTMMNPGWHATRSPATARRAPCSARCRLGTANQAGRFGRIGSGRSTRWPERPARLVVAGAGRRRARHGAVAADGAEHRLSRRGGDGLRRRLRHQRASSHPWGMARAWG